MEIFNSGDIQVSSQGSLVIPNASGHHVGRYLCQGSNGVGQPLQVIVNITVKVPPKINKDKTKVSVAVGEDRINLPCNADGDRPINVKWSKVSKLSPYFIFNLPIFFPKSFSALLAKQYIKCTFRNQFHFSCNVESFCCLAYF